MREPPALKAILAVEATDDLFHDDVHNMDGAFHIDQFEQWMDHLLILPQTPDYELDEDYFENPLRIVPVVLDLREAAARRRFLAPELASLAVRQG